MRKQRQTTDELDAEKAKMQYNTPDLFAQHFSYRKGNKQIVLTTNSSIARQYRKINKEYQYWDSFEEEEEANL